MASVSRLVNRLVPEGATLDEVLSAVETHLGQPVRVHDNVDLGPGTSGLWVHPSSDSPHLVFLAPMPALRREHVLGHELGHMLLGHGTEAARTHYDSPEERDAELFATMMVERMRRPRLGPASLALR